MLIPVVFENGQKGHVVEEMLSYLLEAGGIISFKRHNGWVRPSCDAVRVRSSLVFSIPERRSEMNSMLASDAPLPLDEFR
jgi:hypothetical protein